MLIVYKIHLRSKACMWNRSSVFTVVPRPRGREAMSS